jgi:hypothetical protein
VAQTRLCRRGTGALPELKEDGLDEAPDRFASKFKRFLGFEALWGQIEDLKIQEAIWELDQGIGRRVLLWCMAVLVAVAVGLWYTGNQFHGFQHREAMESAQLARNLSRGEGLTTYVIRPLSLWWLNKHVPSDGLRLMDHPDLNTPPLYPAVLAVLFLPLPSWMFQYNPADIVFLPERWMILPFNCLCLFASVLLVYFWARRMFGAMAAATAALLLVFSETTWAFTISGLPTNLLMLLFLGSLYCLWRADDLWHPTPQSADIELGRRWMSASAALFGLCFLTQYNTVFLAPAMLLYVASVCRERGAWRGVTLYAAICALVISPWLLRNYLVSHSLLGMAACDLMNNVLPSNLRPDLSQAFQLTATARRFIQQSREVFFNLPGQVGSVVLVTFFFVGSLHRLQDETLMRLRRSLWVGLACAAFGLSLGRIEPEVTGSGVPSHVQTGNLLVLFLPLVTTYGVLFFYMMLHRAAIPLRLLRWGVIGVFGLVNAASLMCVLAMPATGAFPYPPYHPPVTARVASLFDKDAIGVSDLPWAMAWVGDRRTVWLPSTPRDLARIHRATAPQGGLSFLFLTPRLLNRRLRSELIKGEYAGWRKIVQGKMPEDCPFTRTRKLPPKDEQLLCTIPPASMAADSTGGRRTSD